MPGYGSFIRHHRIASGYKKQKDLAEASGITAATISRIESEVQRPEPETLQTLAKYLHTTSLVELMVKCGYWPEDEILDSNKSLMVKESPSTDTMKELSKIPIEELDKHILTYKGHVLTDEQKKKLIRFLRAAAEMLDQK